MAPTDVPALLTSGQVCGNLNIDRSTLSRWVATDRITPAFKMPGLRGAFLFSPDEVARVRQQLVLRPHLPASSA